MANEKRRIPFVGTPDNTAALNTKRLIIASTKSFGTDAAATEGATRVVKWGSMEIPLKAAIEMGIVLHDPANVAIDRKDSPAVGGVVGTFDPN